MSRLYYVEATVTYSGYVRARSKDDAEMAAEATSGAPPMWLDGVDFMVLDPRDRMYPEPERSLR